MDLPAGDRLRLAHDRLGSVDDTIDEDAAEAWVAEIGRRAREVEDGSAELIDADEVHRQVRENRRVRTGDVDLGKVALVDAGEGAACYPWQRE